MKIAYQGERGAFSEAASKKYFGGRIEFSPSYSFNDVFIKVKNKNVNCGIVPVENSLYGSIFETYDLLLRYALKITGEINLQINHYLISPGKIKLNEIRKIFSHPQALGQCSEFLKKLPDAKIIPAYDTAGAALISLQQKSKDTAAIASKEAAAIYNMQILKSNIQNNKENYTRFLVISRNKTTGKIANPKTSICFELKSIPGALFKALSVFALRDIDLVKIESRPIPHKPFQYLFYADLNGSLSDRKIKLALNHLSEISLDIKEFGTYNTGKIYKT
jgi:prephenate dehydratase